MDLYPVFEWCESTAVGQVVRDSLWLFPVIEAIHLLALALMGGTILVVDLRLLGFGPPQPTGCRPCRQRPSVAGRRVAHDDRNRRTDVPLGSDQVLLQPAVLVQNVVSAGCDGVHVYRSQSRAGSRSSEAWSVLGPTCRGDFARTVVLRRFLGAVDRVLLRRETATGRCDDSR